MGIVAKNIVKRFRSGRHAGPGFLAVDDVSFRVNRGRMVALLGPSGSGKSTILRMIAGLEIPDSGEVYLEGRNMKRLSARERQVGFVFQHYALFKHMTVSKNIAFGLEVNGWPRQRIKSQVDMFLELVQLTGYAGRYPAQLSGGQRQRVALARALAPQPHFLLLDEPFGALDAKVRRNLAVQLRKLHDEVRTTSIFVTHDQEEAFELADEIVVINRGHVEQIGSAEDVYDHPKTKFVASFIGNVNMVEGVAEDGRLKLGPRRIPMPNVLPPKVSGEVVLLIRPENITLLPDHSESTMGAVVIAASYRGDRYEIILDFSGMEIRAVVDKTRGQNLRWSPGSRAYLQFSQYSVFDADEGHAALRAKLQSLGYLE